MRIKNFVIPRTLREQILQEKSETSQSVPSIIIYCLQLYFEAKREWIKQKGHEIVDTTYKTSFKKFMERQE